MERPCFVTYITKRGDGPHGIWGRPHLRICHESSRKDRSATPDTVRRSFIFVLALSLVGLGPVPLSACAIFSSKIAECATPQTKSRCDQMNMDESIPKVAAAPNASCCSVNA